MNQAVPKKSSLLTIFLVVFIDLVGFGIVIPILPYYAQQYGASAWTLGWLMTSYSLMQFLVAPLWGQLSDRIGRRPVLLASIAGTAVSMVILGMAPSLLWLFIGRIFAGICGANISTAYAYITDVTTEENRAKGMGMVGAAFGLGFIFGPAMGGVLSKHGYSVPMFVGAGLATINWVFAYFALPEPHLTPEERSAHRIRRFDRKAFHSAWSKPQTRAAIFLFFLLVFAVTQMEVTFAIFLKFKFSYDAAHAGMLLAFMGFLMALIQGGLIGKLAKRFGEPRLVIGGGIFCAIGLGIFAGAPNIHQIVIGLTLLGLGHGILHPSLSSLASMKLNPNEHGLTMGVFQSAGSLARVLGPLSAGWLYDQVSVTTPFYSAAGIMIIVTILGIAAKSKGILNSAH